MELVHQNSTLKAPFKKAKELSAQVEKDLLRRVRPARLKPGTERPRSLSGRRGRSPSVRLVSREQVRVSQMTQGIQGTVWEGDDESKRILERAHLKKKVLKEAPRGEYHADSARARARSASVRRKAMSRRSRRTGRY